MHACGVVHVGDGTGWCVEVVEGAGEDVDEVLCGEEVGGGGVLLGDGCPEVLGDHREPPGDVGDDGDDEAEQSKCMLNLLWMQSPI